MVDFLDVALQRGLMHIVKEICDHLPDESIVDMMCVCKGWKDVLSSCGVADRLRATGRLKRWKKALKNPRREVKQIILPQVDHAMVSKLTIVHDYVFCQFYVHKGEFLVYKLDEGSLYDPVHFNTGHDVSHFSASVDFHRSSEESALFGIHGEEGGCLLGNYETGTFSTIFFSRTCGQFIFNRDYVMAAVKRYEIKLLRLYKLTWSAEEWVEPSVERKVLVHEIELGPSTYTDKPYMEIGALGRLLVFVSGDCTATVWTFERGQIVKFQASELKLFDPAPVFDIDAIWEETTLLRGRLGRFGDYLVSVLWPYRHMHTTLCNVFIGRISFDTKEIIPVKRLKHNNPKFCISEVTLFGSSGLLVDWIKERTAVEPPDLFRGIFSRSLTSLEELLRCENLQSLLDDTAVDKKEDGVALLDPLTEVIQIGGCKTCISMESGQLYTL